MNTEVKLIKTKLGLLNLSEQLGKRRFKIQMQQIKSKMHKRF
jgi:hypothetical protein